MFNGNNKRPHLNRIENSTTSTVTIKANERIFQWTICIPVWNISAFLFICAIVIVGVVAIVVVIVRVVILPISVAPMVLSLFFTCINCENVDTFRKTNKYTQWMNVRSDNALSLSEWLLEFALYCRCCIFVHLCVCFIMLEYVQFCREKTRETTL